MEREEARKRAEVMMAFANGSDVQFYDGSTEQWEDLAPECVLFDSKTEYRIKPEPKYRPFKTQEECWNEMLKHEPFGWVEIRVTKLYTQIIDIDKTDVVIPNSIVKFDMAFEDFKFKDGTPFGIKEE